jgi:hypothetical protein
MLKLLLLRPAFKTGRPTASIFNIYTPAQHAGERGHFYTRHSGCGQLQPAPGVLEPDNSITFHPLASRV